MYLGRALFYIAKLHKPPLLNLQNLMRIKAEGPPLEACKLNKTKNFLLMLKIEKKFSKN